MFWNMPIESLEERYSAQWNNWIPEALNEAGVKFTTLYPETKTYEKIGLGQFLDARGTNVFKAAQLSMLLERVQPFDVVFFHDLWFPGIEALFYLRDSLRAPIFICGCLHAGTWDPHDYLSQCKMGRWAAPIEQAWLSEFDLVFVATHFHKELIEKTGADKAKIIITGFPLYLVSPTYIEKQNLVVFPHRLAPEKNPAEFDLIAAHLKRSLPNWEFVKTAEVCKTKLEYYQLLSRAKIAVSCALQETWGIAQQEATINGCVPVCPDSLSYPELYPSAYLYSSLYDAIRKVEEFAKRYDEEIGSQRFSTLVNKLHGSGRTAVMRMVEGIRRKGVQV